MAGCILSQGMCWYIERHPIMYWYTVGHPIGTVPSFGLGYRVKSYWCWYIMSIPNYELGYYALFLNPSWSNVYHPGHALVYPGPNLGPWSGFGLSAHCCLLAVSTAVPNFGLNARFLEFKLRFSFNHLNHS